MSNKIICNVCAGYGLVGMSGSCQQCKKIILCDANLFCHECAEVLDQCEVCGMDMARPEEELIPGQVHITLDGAQCTACPEYADWGGLIAVHFDKLSSETGQLAIRVHEWIAISLPPASENSQWHIEYSEESDLNEHGSFVLLRPMRIGVGRIELIQIVGGQKSTKWACEVTVNK